MFAHPPFAELSLSRHEPKFLYSLHSIHHILLIVQQVDSADELRRIQTTRRKLELSIGARPKKENPHGRRATSLLHSRAAAVLAPASVMVRLATPYRSKRQFPDGSAEVPTVADFSGACEAAYGAGAKEVVELVQAATAATVTPVGPKCFVTKKRTTLVASSWSGSGGSSSLPIAGFSIDVGRACWDDALAGNAAAVPPFGERRPDAPCPTSATATIARASEAPGEAIPSAALAESIDAAVAFAVNMARVAAEASAAATIATTPAAAAATADVDDEARGNREEDGSLRFANSSKMSRPVTTTTAPTLTSTSSSNPPFSFQRLHVTGLGEGGARGEPLVALKAALARHLPAATAAAAAATAASGGSHGNSGDRSGGTLPSRAPVCRPIVVSADATEYLVSGGVWSTVTSIIGRKSVPPVAVAVDANHSSISPSPTEDAGIVDGGNNSSRESCCPTGEEVVEGDGGGAGGGGGGAMYYIDDGCYGSLSGALLRGVQMQPSPLRVHPPQPQRDLGLLPTPAAAASNAAGKPGPDSQDGGEIGTSGEGSEPTIPCEKDLTSCTVWGPTCDGLDCVCRTTQLPDNMEPGRDWLFFPNVGIRSAADATYFNGLKPLDSFYFVRQREDPAPVPSPASTAPPSLTRAMYP